MKRMIIALLILLSASSAFALTATWTGRQSQVQTVTYKYVWSCEYQFSGQRFWRLFEGSCPSYINIE